MFPVKGWAVDPSNLKPQTVPFKERKGRSELEEQNGVKKRKRGHDQSEDVSRLWDKHFRGKEESRPNKQNKKERRRKRLLSSHDVGVMDVSTELNSMDHVELDDDKPEMHALKDKKKKNGNSKTEHDGESGTTIKAVSKARPSALPKLPTDETLTPMQSAMRQKLISARFRHLNQTLYTAPSTHALELFDQNPDMFEDYHAGFRQQVSVWPENPVDNFILTLRMRGKMKEYKNKDKRHGASVTSEDHCSSYLFPLPRTQGTSIVADLGCGDARIASTLKSSGDTAKLNLKIHSFDLLSSSPLVTKADISDLPLGDGTVDIAIFCLALMGTNWISFIEEAYRVLHWKGELWIAEIKSRFGRVGRAGKPVDHSVGGKKKQAALKKAHEAKRQEEQEVDEQIVLRNEVDGVEMNQKETDVSAFVDVLRRRGFVLKDGDRSIDLSNKMFVKMEFVKAAVPSKGKGVSDEKPVAKSTQIKKKFIENTVEDVATDDETKVLKPCLYKVR
ncbi:hypothetical protein M433DRAFT_261636 [Acidomyces richmondensis BFW]|nr:hypothetical protein M433DRAFT_261636 [Acidomyces richmondensis BFW]